MKRLRNHEDPEVVRELEAIDAALNRAPGQPDDPRFAELVRQLRATKPTPRGEFAEALDAKVAERFAADRAVRATGEDGFGQVRDRARLRPHLSRIHPALGIALAGAVLAAVAVPIALSGSETNRAQTSVHAPPREAQSAPAGPVAAPAEPARAPRLAAPSANSANGRQSTPAAAAAIPPSRQVERTATLDLGVAPSSIQSTSQQVFTLVSSYGGYVRQSNVSSGGAYGGASFDLRIPSSKLAGAMAALSHLGHVRSENDTTNDLTDQFNSLQGSLAGLQAERASLLKQLAGASEPRQEAALKARLRALDGRISNVQRELAALRDRVSYTSLALTLSAETPVGSKQGDLTPGGAARDAGQILEAALAVLVIAVAAVVPLAALALAAWLLVVSTRRRMREQALDASR
jgi:hypothetical protein